MEMINIRSLKEKIMRDYPEEAPIRQVILSEPDELPINEYAMKMLVWFKLIPVKGG